VAFKDGGERAKNSQLDQKPTLSAFSVPNPLCALLAAVVDEDKDKDGPESCAVCVDDVFVCSTASFFSVALEE
jgi:hypothetical protein